jgi:hypothetical protein
MARRAQAIQVVEEENAAPSARSVLTITPGLWLMRNGHTAEIVGRLDIPYRDGATGKAKIYAIWKGRCVECGEYMTWTIGGCYAAVGKHRNDIVGKA